MTYAETANGDSAVGDSDEESAISDTQVHMHFVDKQEIEREVVRSKR